MKVYNISVDTEQLSDEGVFTVSLVDKPAIRSNFVYLSEEGEPEKELFSFNEEKGELVGAVLIPDILIPRSNKELGKYYVTFSAETIESIQYKMSRDGFFNYFNLDHEMPTDGVVMLETWIKESDNDKSSNYGLEELPVGTMFFKAKVEDDTIKQRIKDGELNGFSVELKASLIPQMETQTTQLMSQEEILNQLEALKSQIEELKQAEPEQVETETQRVELAEDVAAALSSIVGNKDGYYTMYVSVKDGQVNFADLESHHYQSLMSEQETKEDEVVTETLEETTEQTPEVTETLAEETPEVEPKPEAEVTEENLSEEAEEDAEAELFHEQAGEKAEETAEPTGRVIDVVHSYGEYRGSLDAFLKAKLRH